MPVWDTPDTEEQLTTGTADTIKCPGCGQNIFFDAALGKLVCNYCGGAYDPQTKELSYRLEKKDREDADQQESENHEIVCNSCGSIVVTEKNTAATFCAVCGSPALVSRRLSKQFRPDFIIPFKVTREEAVDKFLKFASKRKFVPSSFRNKATLQKVTGLYVPFWLIDGTCHMKVRGEGRKDRTDDAVDKFDVSVKYDFKVKGVPFDGSKAISDRLMEAIEPFDYDELKPFSNSYLPGFYAERYDLTALDMSERITKRMDLYAGQYARVLCPEYDEFKVEQNESFADDLSQKYALLPVWFLNYEYRGFKYGFAVNGQTGEVDGDMPVSVMKGFLQKLLFWILVIVPVAAVITAVIGTAVWLILTYIAQIKLAIDVIFPFFCIFLLITLIYLYYHGIAGAPSFLGILFSGRDLDKNGTIGRSIDRSIADLKTRYYNLGNEINMLLDEAPEVQQYYEGIPGASIQKEETFIGSTEIER